MKNQAGEIVYTPPQDAKVILDLMANLEQYINNDDIDDSDYLVKMAIIHFQFESIHPFYDGNGRTGRIINILYLFYKGLLDYPILYLSRYIIKNKKSYYELLQGVRDKGIWEDWILFILEGVITTSKETIETINAIRLLMNEFKLTIKDKLPIIYSKDLLENLFKHPYTKIEFLQKDIGKSIQTTSIYLEKLVEIGLLEKMKFKNSNYYINIKLFNLFTQ